MGVGTTTFTVTELRTIDHLWEVEQQEIRTRDAIRSTWTKISKNDSNTLWKVCQEDFRQFWGPTFYKHSAPPEAAGGRMIRSHYDNNGVSSTFLIKWAFLCSFHL